MKDPSTDCADWSRQSAIFHSIVSSIREAVITLDKDFRITFFSPRAQALTGWEPAEVLGRRCSEVLETPSCNGDCAGRRCLDKGGETVLDDHIRCREGSLCPVTRRMVPLVAGDGASVIGMLLILEDRRAFRVDESAPQGFLGIVGTSDPMQHLIRQIQLFAPFEETVLIQGESGTGKELVAKALHTLSPRSASPFVAVNCAALPANLLESEFFGHVRGAFTGAVRDRIGAVEQAGGGTLFLDEIGELAIELQAKLLRFLQERTYSRVGEHQERKSSVRIVAATNRNLEESIAGGRFREDLYFRLSVLPLPVPPLRERTMDIPVLVEHFIRQARGMGVVSRRCPREVMELFLRYPWPGNVRELQNAVKYMVILSLGGPLQIASMPQPIRQFAGTPEASFTASVPSARPEVGKIEEGRIREALRASHGNRKQAALALGMHRTTLYRKMTQHGISPFADPAR